LSFELLSGAPFPLFAPVQSMFVLIREIRVDLVRPNGPAGATGIRLMDASLSGNGTIYSDAQGSSAFCGTTAGLIDFAPLGAVGIVLVLVVV
jgi:hypothetical protein